ncbi:gluconate 2-dehydrogenase subunit 3 family protein [Myceligenerans pegani]|uniref:Gluconate 2-dehydrogenase subunit 3 family protein n=1 Tax=Myceligenerans pegani TaxID=2776917 RepID=A0ABR9MU36_9MICO|nr:gluconate 2-dehydrogenase subunit 3 family protein [Myceligenerans sp. TRM 65318]MBE1874889.1 gluconate 2-dehydrogenase subunit 3 family protein [Myceligenerans sp. TRM 65318]MBE3017160.1 gluconate 2-dehydrogenase subunit 3 family protein [Myceligenerans sp. TRM 65318]
MTAPETTPDETGGGPGTEAGAAVTRRSVLRSLSLISGAGLVGGAALAGCTPDPSGGVATHGRPGDDEGVHQPERSPLPPDDTPHELRFLTDEEARLLEAVLARLAPGDDGDPGAVQMSVATYIDGKLTGSAPYAEPTYTHGPFASAYEESSDEVEEDKVPVAARQLYRYGYQGSRPPQDVYRLGLAALDRYAQTRFGRFFADLSAERQDELLVVLDDHGRRGEGDTVPTSDAVLDQAGEVFGAVDPGGFFAMVRTDMIEGMFADPVYGGNRDLAGWRLIGWPGAQRSYSPHEMLHGTDKQPRPMHELPVMNPDRPGGGRQALERPHAGSGEG